MRSLRRGIIAAGAASLGLALAPQAVASIARPVAQIPGSAGLGLNIEDVSDDGRRVLLTTQRDAVNSTSQVALWSVDTVAGSAIELLADARLTRHPSVSPDGDWTAWTAQPSPRSCARAVYVARTDGSAAPRRLALPEAHARRALNGVTVGAGGRVTARVAACRDGYPTTSRAILTAEPGATELRAVVAARSARANWPASQDGRVLAMCRQRGAKAEVVVIDSDPVLAVSRAMLPSDSPRSVSCVASAAGTATMSVVRRRPGVPRKAGLKRYRRTGVTIGPGGTSRFQLPPGVAFWSELESVSPSGGEVIMGLFEQRALVVETATGRHSRPFRTPQDILNVPVAGESWLEGVPRNPWSPFAPAIMLSDIRGTGAVRVVNPRARRSTRALRVVARRRSPGAQVCFLPSGRILLDVESMASASQLVISNAARSHFTRLDTSAIGTVASASCGAAAAGRLFVATVGTGRVYELDARTVDASPLIVG